MKNNFKQILLITIMIFGLLISITKVSAAYAYIWTVDGERITMGSSNKSETASWANDSNYSGGILTLNNYNGGQLKIECGGTGLGHVFAIKLVGDNKITVDKGVGIVADLPIIFIGDGKLTITAAVPIGSDYIENDDNYTLTKIDKVKFHGSTTITINPTVIQNNNEPEEPTTNKEDVKNQDDNFLDSDLFKIIILSYCVISLIAMIILIAKLSKRNNI